MKVITVRKQVRTVAARYLEKSSRVVESDGRAERRFFGAWQEKIYNRLLALDVETATPADVAGITGSERWIDDPLICDQCGQERPAVVEFAVMALCAECLRAALAAIQAEAEAGMGFETEEDADEEQATR